MQIIEVTKSTYRYRSTWFQLIRPLTLTGTISPILAGTALAASRGDVRFSIFLVFLLASILIQMAINILNDYFDFQKGQDAEKWGPDGKGPIYEILPVVAGEMIGAAAVCGIWLAFQSHLWVFLLGAIGVLSGCFYSAGKHSFSSLGVGEVIAAVFLGLVVTFLAYAVQNAPIDENIFAIAVPYASLIASMILSNNIRDMEKDKGFRMTIPMRLGRRRAVKLLTLLIIFPYVWTFGLFFLWWNVSSVLILLAFPLALRLRWSFRKDATLKDESTAMKWSALHHWLFGLLYAFVIVFS